MSPDSDAHSQVVLHKTHPGVNRWWERLQIMDASDEWTYCEILSKRFLISFLI